MTYASAVLADSPVHFWDLQEASGTTATDGAGGTTDNGTYTNASGSGHYLLAQTGPIAGTKAVYLEGGSTYGYVALTKQANITITGDLTIEAWVNFDDVTKVTYIMTHGNPGAAGQPYLFYLNGSGGLTHAWGNFSFAPTSSISSGPTMSNATWYHVAMTRISTTINFYVNGVQYSASAAFTSAADNFSPAPRLGARATPGSTEGGKYLAYAAIWNSGLTSTQIANHYAARIAAAGKSQAVFIG